MNKIFMLGRLTRNPELRKTNSGISVATFGIAKNEKQKDGSEKAIFLDCDSFGTTAENLVKYFTKGRKILVEGKLAQDIFPNKDGWKICKIKIIVEKFEFVDVQNDSNNASKTFEKSSESSANTNNQVDDAIPF